MTTAIQALTEAAKKVRAKNNDSFGITSACVDVAITSQGTEVQFRVWNNSRVFKGNDLESVVQEAIKYDTKAAKLQEAAELRKRASALELEAA